MKEGVKAAHFFKTASAFRRCVPQNLQSLFSEATHFIEPLGFALHDLAPSSRMQPIEVATMPGNAYPLDEIGLNEPSGRSADRPFTRAKGFRDLSERLLGRIRYEEPAEHTSHHAGESVRFERQADVFNVLKLVARHWWFVTHPYAVLLVQYLLNTENECHETVMETAVRVPEVISFLQELSQLVTQSGQRCRAVRATYRQGEISQGDLLPCV
jgi:hypothetical protein